MQLLLENKIAPLINANFNLPPFYTAIELSNKQFLKFKVLFPYYKETKITPSQIKKKQSTPR